MLKNELVYALTRRRRRSLCLQVQEDLSLRVLAPLRARQAEIDAFVGAQQRWIERKRAELRARGPGVTALPPDGAWLPILDGALRLQRTPLKRGVRQDLTTLRVGGNDDQALRALKTWYRARVRAEAEILLTQWEPVVGRRAAGLVIREQRTRWGSCASSGMIALNWRLALGPRILLEYVVVHELCHLTHRHHQPAFWQEVERALPDYRQRRAALRTLAATWFPTETPDAGPHPATMAE